MNFRLEYKMFNMTKRRLKLITLEDVKKNSEVQALIEGAQKQLDELRIYRTLI